MPVLGTVKAAFRTPKTVAVFGLQFLAMMYVYSQIGLDDDEQKMRLGDPAGWPAAITEDMEDLLIVLVLTFTVREVT